ncbi:MAG: hypothetical protein WC372_10680 [Candidatus Neomarinimicrobiota bacterium]|jgi:hypothetical protein
MADLSFYIPKDKGLGYHVGSLPSVVGLSSVVFTGAGIPVEADSTCGMYISDSGYTSLTYPITFTATVTSLVDSSVSSHNVTLNLATISSTKLSTVYVDPINGNNNAEGTELGPISSLDLALEKVRYAGTILLYEGGFGSRTLDQAPLTLKALKGNLPFFIDILSTVSSSYTFEGLTFFGTGLSIEGDDSGVGSLTVRGCQWLGASSTLHCKGYRYLSAMQNYIKGGSGINITISNVQEAAFTSNMVSGSGIGSFTVEGTHYFTLIYNTINNIETITLPDVEGSTGVASGGVIYYTIDEAYTKQIMFPESFSYDGQGRPSVAINLLSGAEQTYGQDWAAYGGIISWEGMGGDKDTFASDEEALENGAFMPGDKLRIIYQFDVAEANYTYRVDSNNLTSIGTFHFGTFTALNVYYNNFYDTTVEGATLASTNITADPLYIDATNGDLSLSSGSPSIGAGRPWDTSSVAIPNNALYQNLQDIASANRIQLGDTDIGAKETLLNVLLNTSLSVFIKEGSYDLIRSGSESSPIKRVSAAMKGNASKPVKVILGEETQGVSTRKDYFDEKVIELTSVPVGVADTRPVVGDIEKSDYAVINPMDSFIPYSSDEGKVFVAPSGDDDKGEGTYEKPYRTIDAAIAKSAAPTICVLAGSYPMFTGAAGRTLVFLKNIQTMGPEDAFLFDGFTAASWVITESTGTTYTINDRKLTIAHP